MGVIAFFMSLTQAAASSGGHGEVWDDNLLWSDDEAWPDLII